MSHNKVSNAAKDIHWGHFYCPKCNNVRPYLIKRASIDFTFYSVPIFETGDLNEFVVCLLCKKGFDPQILDPNNQTIFRLAGVARRELMHISPEELKKKLIRDGLKEPLINKLITVAQNS